MILTSNVRCSLRRQFKIEGQTKYTDHHQKVKTESKILANVGWVSLIGLWTIWSRRLRLHVSTWCIEVIVIKVPINQVLLRFSVFYFTFISFDVKFIHAYTFQKVEIYEILMDLSWLVTSNWYPVQKYGACLILALVSARPKNKPGIHSVRLK